MEELIRLTKENNKLLKDNNRMLREIIDAINAYLFNVTHENRGDFERNIIANLISTHMTRF